MDRGLKVIVALAGVSGAVGVAAGAFGAHGAAHAEAKAWLQTGGQYQLLHALAALAAANLGRQIGERAAMAAAVVFLAGAAVFAGSLYAMAAGGPRGLGAITPLGGLAMILGWLCLGGAGVAALCRRP